MADPALAGFWRAVKDRLERTGLDHRGRLRVPALTSQGRFLLKGLTGAEVGATVDLALLEARLRALGAGDDLEAVLAGVGCAVSKEPARRREARRRMAEARSAARYEVAGWPEPWAGEWIDSVVRAGTLAGLDTEQAVGFIRRVRAVLSAVELGDARSRVDLAATVLASAHALDWGTREEAAVTKALEVRHDQIGRRAWEAAGVELDLVSAPVLTFGLRLSTESPLAPLVATALELRIPLHLTQMALRSHPVALAAGTDVLVVENPRVVEAAAQRGTPHPVVALNGNPSTTAVVLLEQLLAAGARLRYHGDFDASGLRICARMHRMGLVPWRMDAIDYLAALDAASGVADLPTDTHRAPPTPWDAALQETFDRERKVVHEERLLDQLLGETGSPVREG